MKHILFKTWLILVCLIVGVGTTWAENVTFNLGTTSGKDISSSSGTTKSNITVSFANGSGSALSWQTDHVRFYHNGSKVTISSTSTNITKIVVNAKSGYASADLKVGSTSLESNDAKTVYTYTPASAINTVTITNNGSAQARLTSIVVTVGGSTPTALSAPTNLSSSNVTTTGATLSWDAVANASSYTVKIGAQEYTGVTTTSYNATGLTAGTQYTWSVKAVGDGENYSTSAYAANANFTTVTPTHKAYFYVNGTLQNEGGTSFAEGGTITFPSDPADINGKKFQGWTKTQNYTNATTAPSDMTKSATMGDADVTYYAVFATVDGEGSKTWNQVTTLSGIKTGTYVIINGGFCLPSTTTGGSTPPTATTAPTVSDGAITGTVTDAMKWTLSSTGANNQFYVKNSDDKYLYATNDNNGIRVNTTSDKWTFAVNTTGYFSMKDANNNRYCGVYNSQDWRSYNSATASNYANGGKLALYKLTSNTTYSDYCTSLVTKYDVTFNLQGHSEAIESQSIAEGETVTEPTAPTATGYTFGGWYKEAECTNAWNFSTDVMGTSAVTLYAKWTADTYTITYNNVEGAAHSNPATYTIETETINLADASKEGFIFQGWFDNEGLTGDAVTTITQGSTGNKTFWAKWIVRVKPATPTFSTAAGTIEKGTEITISCTTENAAIYYTTNGDDPTEESTPYTAAITVNTTQTIKAVAILGDMQSDIASAAYTIAQHTAHFSINGVITDANNCTVAKGEAITFPANPAAPEDYVFIGWKKGGEEVTTPQADAIATVDKAAEVMGTGDVTYYAVWAVQSGSGEANYTKLSSNSFDRNAVYVLAAEESSDESTLHYFSSYTSTTANERWGVTSTNVADAITFTLSGTAGALVAKDASGNYIQALATGNFRMSSGSTTLKLDANGRIYNPTSGNEGFNLRYNHNNGSGGFRWYNSSIGTSAYFYKYNAGTTYSDYCTIASTKTTPTLSFANPTYYATMGEDFTAPVLNNTHSVDVTYSSSETGVATVNATTGVVELVAAGTTIITAAFDGNENYNAASASYELIVAAARDAHTARFSVNGSVNEALNSTVSEGAHITFPANPEPQYGLTFMGWSSEKIEGTLADAPSMIDTETEVMGNADVTYYAVFAKQTSGTGGEVTEELTNAEVTSLSSSAALAYATETTYTDGTIDYSIYAYTDNTNRKWIQVKKDQGVYVKITAPSAIKKVKATLTSPTNSKGGVDDITMHTAYSGYVALCESDCAYTSSSASVASTNAITDNVATLEPTGVNTELYLKVSTGARIWNISVTYGSDPAYSDYCTSFITFDEANTTIEEVFDTYGRVEVKRTIKADTWNTFCVPFNMDNEQITANFGADAEVKKLDGLNVSATNFNMHFGDAESIEAGVPYMVRVQNPVSSIVVYNADVTTVDNGEEYYDPTTVNDNGNSLTFHGNYTKQSAEVGSFIISSNLFYYVDKADYVTLKGFRGYITTDEGSAARALTFSFDNLVTGISTNLDTEQGSHIYNLQGLQQHKLSKGVNIVNGRKVIK